ncbi:hypothetical protein ACFSPU_12535 [Haoranjiania flava]|uniref:DUF1801 domain-containing protein n=1 Tax=Haoranjiania flava TaxID=1856322 RepID=A0AAE3IQF1_9BACT|nr:hypothetical protein [Haoranjiania flava]MCU7695495.1 hypothetical protein [Haoranjiania flava]
MADNYTFNKLKTLLKKYEAELKVLHDKEDNYYLNTPMSDTNKKTEFFGAVQIKKSYVAFHLMPLYYYPNLLDNISQGLKNHMQGKSCFNFKAIDDKLLKELSDLIKNSFQQYKSVKKI